MATLTLTPARNANISHSFGEASFASYAKGNEESFLAKLAETTLNPSTTMGTSQEIMYQVSLGRKKHAYGEIGIFGAEKYFNGVMDDEDTANANKNKQNRQEKKDGKLEQPKSKREAPSSCSEASWNSRSALLPIIQSRQEKGNSKNILTTLGCKGYCSDYKSVDVEENTADTKSSISSKRNADFVELHGKVIAKLPTEIKHDSVGTIKIKATAPSWFKEESSSEKLDKVNSGRLSEDCFTLSIPKPGLVKLPVERQIEKVEEEKERKSLEVFGSPVMGKAEIALSLEKRLSVLTWDANPKVENSPIVPTVRSVPDDDADSDSSSDLFEIKSLSNSGNPFFRRQASDSMSGCMSPSTCYEPSEASIDWSVVTASAANFSVASDYDEPKPRNTANVATTAAKTGMNKNMEKRRPSKFLSCRSQHAVNVAGGAHKLPEKKPEFKAPRSRLQAESKVTDLESAHAQRAFAIGPLSQLHPARTTDSPYMH